MIFLLLLVISVQAQGLTQIQTSILTVCPDDYVTRNGCVTPDYLNNNLKSNTTYRFVPAFKMLPNQVLRLKGVRNIVLDTAGPDRSSISCLGENSGFHFESVYGLTIRNLQFINCAMRNISYTYYASLHFTDCTVFILFSTIFKLDNVAFEHGKPGAYSLLATQVYGSITIYFQRNIQTLARSCFVYRGERSVLFK